MLATCRKFEALLWSNDAYQILIKTSNSSNSKMNCWDGFKNAGNIKEITQLNIARWQKHLWELKYWKLSLMDMSSATTHHANAKTMTSLHDFHAKITHRQTWWPLGATRKRWARLHSFIAAAVWGWSDVTREEEKRRRSLSPLNPASLFFQASSLIFSLFCMAVSSEVPLVIRYY